MICSTRLILLVLMIITILISILVRNYATKSSLGQKTMDIEDASQRPNQEERAKHGISKNHRLTQLH